MPGQWLAAGAGFAFHFLNSKWQEERKARIERVNAQLRNFYGPLLAAVSATKSAYDALIAQHSPDGSRGAFQEAVQGHPGGCEAEAYRLWVESVLQPLNEQAAVIVSDHIDMLDNPRMVPELLQLVAHVSTMRVVLQRWQRGDYAAASAITYPDKLLGHCEAEFNRVKARQAQLLGEQVPTALAASKGRDAAGHGGGGSGGVQLETRDVGAGGRRSGAAASTATAAGAAAAGVSAAAALQRGSGWGGGGGGSGEHPPRSKL
ncbi:MAG: hypothetical protein J3K34DRAFT_432029 [Monoraphidium minutum]|nr:MAG: hypothetical protein J3K34DRAFT_432029 [Monoraphidium minutum]